MSDAPQASQVIEIKPDCKYIIEVPASMSQEYFRATVDQIREWWKSGESILLLGGGLTLRKVESEPLVSQSENTPQ